MTVGVDLRIFQIGHQYRGIGAHISNLFREFSKMEDLPKFVFFEHPNIDSGLTIIEKYLPKLDYEVRHTNNRLIGETYFKREWTSFKQRNLTGDAGLGDLSGIDVMLSIDFNLGVPKPRKVRTVLISYDMIPWVLSEYYLPNYAQTFKKTKSLKRAFRATLDKKLYFLKFKQANSRAEKILSISEHTKKDLVKYLRINPNKIETVLLGIDHNKDQNNKSDIACKSTEDTNIVFDTAKEKYVFFMGGADRRRKIEDLVSAFDLLAKDNRKFHLILAGYDFQSLSGVPDKTTREAITDAKHRNRIFFAGYISDDERTSLFANAIAFVFPSVYEGFGLPILESMTMKCPVIAYKNSSIPEVGGDAILYATDEKDIESTIRLLATDAKLREELVAKSKSQLNKFSWNNTASKTISIIKNLD